MEAPGETALLGPVDGTFMYKNILMEVSIGERLCATFFFLFLKLLH